MGTLRVLLPWLALLLLQAASASSEAKPGCLGTCGDIEVPYPFGLSSNCSHGEHFNLTCNESVVPHKLMWGGLQVFNISVERGEMTISLPISYGCYKGGQKMTNQTAHYYANLVKNSTFTFSTKNRFTTIGCDTLGLFSGSWGKEFTSGCATYCNDLSSLNATNSSCDGVGCCQTTIPKGVRKANISITSFNNYSNLSPPADDLNCGYAFLVGEGNFTFQPDIYLKAADQLLQRRPSMPVLVDWAIGDQGDTCKTSTGEKGGSGCLAKHSECINSTAGYGYRCNCSKGYHGNPYLENDGCQEIKKSDFDRLAYKAVATCVSIMFLLFGVGRLVVRFNVMPKWVIDAIKKESNQNEPDPSSSTGEDMKKKRYPVVKEDYFLAAKKCKKKLRTLIAENRCAPIMLCLAWQDVNAKTGKPFGTITHQFTDEDINKAVNLLAKLKGERPFDKLSDADICQLAGVMAVEVAGGPDLAFHPGREDNAENMPPHDIGTKDYIVTYLRKVLIDSSLSQCVGCPDVAFHPGREDNAANMPPHDIGTKESVARYLTEVLNDRSLSLCVHDIVAISPWLRCNEDCSGFQFTWPPTFDNSYFKQLIRVAGEKKSLPDHDQALKKEDVFVQKYAEDVGKYAEDEALFFAAYAKLHMKLSEVGFADVKLSEVGLEDDDENCNLLSSDLCKCKNKKN